MNTAAHRMVVVLVLGALALAPAALAVEDKTADLKVGDVRRPSELWTTWAKPWKSTDHVGKKYVVVYFLPRRLHARMHPHRPRTSATP